MADHDLNPLTELAEKTVRDGHIYGYTVVEHEHLVAMDRKPQDFFDAIRVRAEAMGLVLKIENNPKTRRYEFLWRPARRDEDPSVTVIS